MYCGTIKPSGLLSARPGTGSGGGSGAAAGTKPAAALKDRLTDICSACLAPVNLGLVGITGLGSPERRPAGKRRVTDCAQAAALALARVGGAPGVTRWITVPRPSPRSATAACWNASVRAALVKSSPRRAALYPKPAAHRTPKLLRAGTRRREGPGVRGVPVSWASSPTCSLKILAWAASDTS